MANVAPTIPARDTASPARPRLKRSLLLIGFAFAVMADPVSSVAYTIEASLRALNGHLGLLMPTQLIVLGIIALVDVNYWQLVARYPLGGGSAEAAARAFGTGWGVPPNRSADRRLRPDNHDLDRRRRPIDYYERRVRSPLLGLQLLRSVMNATSSILAAPCRLTRSLTAGKA